MSGTPIRAPTVPRARRAARPQPHSQPRQPPPLSPANRRSICSDVGVWPHAVLSGHAHNYQRFTRVHGQTQIPYIVCGNGGHGLARLARKNGGALRTPQSLPVQAHYDKVILENYDDQHFGYLRVVVTPSQLRIEYQPASDGTDAKTPDDFVTVDLATRKLVHFTG